jgi:hypothetical protein
MLVKLPPLAVRHIPRLEVVVSLKPLKNKLHVGRGGSAMHEVNAFVRISRCARLVFNGERERGGGGAYGERT